MKKGAVIGILILAIFTSLIIYFQDKILPIVSQKVNKNLLLDQYQYGEADGEFGKIKLKIKTDDYGAIKELYVIEYDDSYEDSVKALQVLANNSKNKYNADDIDIVSGATVTSEVYKKALNRALNVDENENIESKIDDTNIATLSEIDVKNKAIRNEIEISEDADYCKTGLGSYIVNNLSDADYNKDGELATDEYVCGVMIRQDNSIEKIKFDHMSSNMLFNNKGYIPTGTSRLYSFFSDSQKEDFVGYALNEGGIDLVDFENACIKLKTFDEIKKHYMDKKAYLPYISALEYAILNAKNLGAKSVDTIGIASKKTLEKKNIINANDSSDGFATFDAYYTLVTVNNELNITSSIIDTSINTVSFDNRGKISGDKDNVVNTFDYYIDKNEYSNINVDCVNLVYECNQFADMIKGENINNVILMVSDNTDNRGKWIKSSYDFPHIDFLSLIDILTQAFLYARKI